MASGNIIHDVFDEAQKSQKMHKVGSKKLLKLLSGERAKEAFMSACQCFDKVLSCSKKESAAELTIRFFVSLVSTASDDVFLSFLNYLLDRSASLDKIVRFRACQTISCVFKELPEDSEIDDALWESLSEMLLPRLRDKCPNVRTWALRALRDLQDPCNADDPIMQEFMRMMQSDTSKDVRIVAIESIDVNKQSLAHIIHRLRDVKTDVRVAATQKLIALVEINHLSQKQRALVVRHALNDREDSVREKALELMVKWLHSSAVDNSVPKLLHLVGLSSNLTECKLLAWSLIEAATTKKQFTVCVSHQNHVVTLDSAVENDAMVWESSFTGLPPSDLLWTLLRCDFYHKTLSSDHYTDRVERFLPDTVVLCQLLREGHALLRDDECPQVYELAMELLLQITAFVDTSDIAGSKALVASCKDMIKDLKFLETLVEPVLAACSKAMSSIGANIGEDMVELSQEIWPSVLEVDEVSNDDPFQPKDPNVELAQLRSLQVAAWTIRDKTANTRAAPVDALIPMVLQSLQQPIKELRSAALCCLGLLGISCEQHCESFSGIVLQVASANQEDCFIRCQAIESLTDMAMVHSDDLISQDNLASLLCRMIDCDTALIQRIAAEASAKLLFSGRIVKSPVLFARLVQVYFCTETSVEEESNGYALFSNAQWKHNGLAKGSKEYLDQLLSIFFPAFLSAGEDRSAVAVDCVASLISNCAMQVRDGAVENVPLLKMVENLLAWCEFSPSPASSQQQMKIRLCAATFKEILSLNSSDPSSKQLLKELTKLITVLLSDDWIANATTAKSAARACCFIKNQCLLDKVSSKNLTALHGICKTNLAKLKRSQEDNEVDYIQEYAPVLLDLIQGDEASMASDDDNTDEDEDFEDRESDGEVSKRSRAGRSSKNKALSRISKQLTDENASSNRQEFSMESESNVATEESVTVDTL